MSVVKSLVDLSLRLKKISEVTSTLPSFRFRQIVDGIYKNKWKKYDDFQILSADIRESLVQKMGHEVLSLKPKTETNGIQMSKLLFEMQDKNKVESVWMQFEGKHTSLCISTQVGCAMNCSFCATGTLGLKRQMTADEISDQVLYFLQQGKTVDSISFMGMGEPLMNPKVFDALSMLTHQSMFGMSQRRISISTIGVIPAMERLTREFPDVNLAFSLHSPFNEQRSELVPQNKVYPLNEVLKTLQTHAQQTKRRIFLAYLVLDGINDSDEHLKAVLSIFKSFPQTIQYLFHLNLLRYNPAFGISGALYQKTKESNLRRLQQYFESHGISVSVRQSFGVEQDAACGQLYAQSEAKRPKTVLNKEKPVQVVGKPTETNVNLHSETKAEL